MQSINVCTRAVRLRLRICFVWLLPSTIDETTGSSALSLGCYKDDRGNRIMDELALSEDSMTTEVNSSTERVRNRHGDMVPVDKRLVPFPYLIENVFVFF